MRHTSNHGNPLRIENHSVMPVARKISQLLALTFVEVIQSERILIRLKPLHGRVIGREARNLRDPQLIDNAGKRTLHWRRIDPRRSTDHERVSPGLITAGQFTASLQLAFYI